MSGRVGSVALAAVLLLACAGPRDATRQDPGERARSPNVLFLIADDLTASALSCYGNADVATPNIDRLARRGVRFTRAYCQYPVCGPARAALLSGLHPDALGLERGGSVARIDELLGERPALGEHFRSSGYHTARVGKVFHMRVPGDVTAGADGDDHSASWDERFNCPGAEWKTRGEHELLSNERIVRDPEKHYGLGFGTAFYTVRASAEASRQPDELAADRAIEVLRERRDEPFFLAVGFVRPHVPLVAPEEYFARFDPGTLSLPEQRENDWNDIPEEGIAPYDTFARGLEDEATRRRVLAGYYAAVAFLDAQVGRVLDELDALGLADDTIVVFTSDHGYHLGEHDFWQKLSLHEESARVPLLVAAPGVGGTGERAALVEHVDLYPTLAALAGLDVPAHCQGESLAAVIAGREASVRDAAYSVCRGARLLRTERWAYITYDGGAAELYDMRADPSQFTNVVDEPRWAETVRELDARLRRRHEQVRGAPAGAR